MLKLYKQKILSMNIFNQTYSTSSTSVFIEADNFQKIKNLKELLAKGSSQDIKKYFFPTSDGGDLNINKLTTTQINKHQQALSYRNKNLLKSLLKSSQEGELDSVDLKLLHECGQTSPGSHEDVHQYLTFNQEIDFGTLRYRK